MPRCPECNGEFSNGMSSLCLDCYISQKGVLADLRYQLAEETKRAENAEQLADIRVVELHKITDEQARGYALMTEETRLRKAAEIERDAALAEAAGLRATLESVKHYVQHIRVGPTDRMSLDEKQSAIEVICAALAALEKGE